MFIGIILGILFCLMVQEPLLLVAGSANVLFNEFQSGFLQPESLSQKTFLSRIEHCYWANSWGNDAVCDFWAAAFGISPK